MDYTKAVATRYQNLSQYMSPEKLRAYALDMAFTYGKAGDFTLGMFWCELLALAETHTA